jgi:hypothetical protein
MTRISALGNEEGFVLLDALICLFTAALILLFLSCAVSGTLRSSVKALQAGTTLIDERNGAAVLLIEGGNRGER